MKNISLTSAGSHVAPPGYVYPSHKHSTWELMYYRDGRTEFDLDGQKITCRAGLLLTTRPGSIQSERAITAYSTWCLLIDAPADSPWPTLCYDDTNQSIAQICRTLAEEWAGNGQRRTDMIAAALAQLDIRLSRAADHRSDDERMIAEAKRLIDEGISGGIKLADVSRQLAVCPAVLRDRFKKVSGTLPVDYMQTVRVRQAVAMLRSSNLTLEAIAAICGYNSASHLSRQVKSATGETPGALRGSENDSR